MPCEGESPLLEIAMEFPEKYHLGVERKGAHRQCPVGMPGRRGTHTILRARSFRWKSLRVSISPLLSAL